MNALVATISLLSLVSCFSSVFLSIALRRTIDWDAFHRDQKKVEETLLDLLPKNYYRPVGQKLWWWRNLSFAVMLSCVAAVVISQQIK